MSRSPGYRLEQYSILHPAEILIVQASLNGEPDEVTIFKGFSSSLMQATSPDPDVPILAAAAEILTIDRVKSPYRPAQPDYIQRSLTWPEMERLLETDGI